jgi:hypothetical protein
MIDVLMITLPIIPLAVLFFMGRNFAALQIKKRASFMSAFNRSVVLISSLSILVYIPFAIAAILSFSQFPDAMEAAYQSNAMLTEQLVSSLLTIFSMVTIPFMVGFWLKYRVVPETAQA